ncbi:hypothetical protein METBIDRAFT_46035 [Metschnikowia bicuspidata var. bicuspidata NRRL YB-4993]|uniref:BHLH domain-containing protein n=1 Tax=Metschnikowia bicuspidata var. bicuspidata NRRL YB-4993 TaxID=869754 RepID=A0A1A0H702_9ASCO|nr:hypothetical protein METBIDRAFT_46035 [Metschnikowia bicuspidata var. bicuspidata NRRL YB-4993]OBA19678.1 hypothetical protein METBIDRAFT_46035 [Metschnikowia bicuspidata var. bicuspidata NRRL YB-4993]
MQLSAPPKLKTTIIQLNKDIDPEDNNYEVLSNDYASDTKNSLVSFSLGVNEEQPRKKRRRSSSTIGEDELAKRRTETKQLHSMIEKRRRIKINREFEALKYLIPACRTADHSSRRVSAASNNANKIDGMYKLTILKTAVEYILYLHHILQKQHSLLSSSMEDFEFDISFADIPLDVNQYRNIDQEFDFHEFASRCASQSDNVDRQATFMSQNLNSTALSIAETEEGAEEANTEAKAAVGADYISWNSRIDQCTDQLTATQEAAEISPILTMLGKHKSEDNGQPRLSSSICSTNLQTYQSFLFANPSGHSNDTSTSTSPFTIPIKTLIKKNMFSLPDPALTSTNARCCGLISPESVSMNNDVMGQGQAYPRKMYFKSQVPPNNLIANVDGQPGHLELSNTEVDKLENASRMLLLLRKPSIGQLLN